MPISPVRIHGGSDPPQYRSGLVPRVHSPIRSATMKISALSLDSQLAILNRLPSGTLIGTVPLVCTRWNQLQPHACRQRRTVTLIIRPNPQRIASPFDLNPASFNAQYAVGLSTTFPRVTHLEIDNWNWDSEELNQQLHLLQSWTSTLVSLQLTDAHSSGFTYTFQKSRHFSGFLVHLLALLNQMPHLKRLSLITTFTQVPPSFDLSHLLRRLVDVELDFIDSMHLLVRQLLQHCSPTLKRLSLGTIYHIPVFLPLLTNPPICSKLVGLKMERCDTTQLAIIVDCCTNLRSLYLHLSTFQVYAERLHLLTKLPRLTELTLTQYRISRNDPRELVSAPLPVLSSIRRLIIYIGFNNFPTRQYLDQVTRLDEVFPQLEQIWLQWPNILCCRTDRRHRNSCITALLRPLARLETLQVARVRIHWKNKFSNWLPRLRRQ